MNHRYSEILPQGQEQSILAWHKADITQKIKNSQIFKSYSNQLPKQPMKPHKINRAPLVKLGADYLEVDEQHYLAIADYFNKIPFAKNMNTMTFNCLKSLFAIDAVPGKLINDNETQFISA